MAKIRLQDIRHSYNEQPVADAAWALKGMSLEWTDGGAYALLGPSGCGKTTMLNIISGLLQPTKGEIWFDDKQVTKLSPDQRNIAQVFQFPVVYDTMTVYQNLAFPLRNRGITGPEADRRVHEIATMLDLEEMLPKRASGLTADGKQKISLGRGLIRADVNAILFDEPLTVIDPHLKWVLRYKLKELHQKVGSTMIYVTHDQTEALTFADQVVVMHEGVVVQVGTPIELFEKPQHTFVGHFIGSPGMNVLPCTLENQTALFDGQQVLTANQGQPKDSNATLEIGIRPEFVRFTKQGIPVEIVSVSNNGRHQIVETRHEQTTIRLLLAEDEQVMQENPQLHFEVEHTYLYADGWLSP